MANSKSALKRLRTSEKERIRNKARKSELKSIEKKFRTEAENGSKDAMRDTLNTMKGKLDKAVKKGVIHKNKANRKKSQLAKLLNSQSA